MNELTKAILAAIDDGWTVTFSAESRSNIKAGFTRKVGNQTQSSEVTFDREVIEICRYNMMAMVIERLPVAAKEAP